MIPQWSLCLAGDANFDGIVSGDDYFVIDANIGRENAIWFTGDLNGDGIVTGDDYTIVDATIDNKDIEMYCRY